MSQFSLYIQAALPERLVLRKAAGDPPKASGTLEAQTSIADAPKAAAAPTPSAGGPAVGGGESSSEGGEGTTGCPFGGGESCEAMDGDGFANHRLDSQQMRKHADKAAADIRAGEGFKDDEGNDINVVDKEGWSALGEYSSVQDALEESGRTLESYQDSPEEQKAQAEADKDPITAGEAKPVVEKEAPDLFVDEPLEQPVAGVDAEAGTAAGTPSAKLSADEAAAQADEAPYKEVVRDYKSPFAAGETAAAPGKEGEPKPPSDSRFQEMAGKLGDEAKRKDIERLGVIEDRVIIARRDYENLTAGEAGLSDSEAKDHLKADYSDKEVSLFLKDPDKPFDVVAEYQGADDGEDFLKFASPSGPSEGQAAEAVADKPYIAGDAGQPAAPDTDVPDQPAAPDTDVSEQSAAPDTDVPDKPFLADPNQQFSAAQEAGVQRGEEYHRDLPKNVEEALAQHEDRVARHGEHKKAVSDHAKVFSGEAKRLVEERIDTVHKKQLADHTEVKGAFDSRKRAHDVEQSKALKAHGAQQTKARNAYKDEVDGKHKQEQKKVKERLLAEHAADEPEKVKKYTKKEMFKTPEWKKVAKTFEEGGTHDHPYPGKRPPPPKLRREPPKSNSEDHKKWKAEKAAYDADMKPHESIKREVKGVPRKVETYLADYQEALNNHNHALEVAQQKKVLSALNEPYRVYKEDLAEWTASKPKAKVLADQADKEVKHPDPEYKKFQKKEFVKEKFTEKSPAKPKKTDISLSDDQKLTIGDKAAMHAGDRPKVPADLVDEKGKLIAKPKLDAAHPKAPKELTNHKDQLAHNNKVSKVSEALDRAKVHLAQRQDLSAKDRAEAHAAVTNLSFLRGIKHQHTSDQIKQISRNKETLKNLGMHLQYKPPSKTAAPEVPRAPENDIETAGVHSHNEKVAALLSNAQGHLDAGGLSDAEKQKVNAVLQGAKGLTDLNTVPTKEQQKQLRELSKHAGKHGRPYKVPKEAKGAASRRSSRATKDVMGLRGAWARGKGVGARLAQAGARAEAGGEIVGVASDAVEYGVRGAMGMGHYLLNRNSEYEPEGGPTNVPPPTGATASSPATTTHYIPSPPTPAPRPQFAGAAGRPSPGYPR